MHVITIRLSTDGTAPLSYGAYSTEPDVDAPRVEELRHSRTVYGGAENVYRAPRDTAHVRLTLEQAEALVATLQAEIREELQLRQAAEELGIDIS